MFQKNNYVNQKTLGIAPLKATNKTIGFRKSNVMGWEDIIPENNFL